MDETYNNKSQLFTTISSESVVHLIEELQNTNNELRDARRAALNLMDDAMRSKEALQQSEEKYRSLFTAIDEGFCIFELVYDAAGRAVDWIYTEANPAFERQTGYVAPVGKTISHFQPDLERLWFEKFADVARTGRAIRFTQYTAAMGIWYDVYAMPVGEAGSHRVSLLFSDVTERKQREQKQAYELTLSDAIRSIKRAVDIEQAVSTIALDYFGADRCYYCTIEGDQAVIRRDAKKGDLPSVAGTYPLSSFAIFKKVVDEGQVLVVTNARTAPVLDEPLRELCLSLQVISFVDVPVVKNGKVAGILCLVQSTPRQWTGIEIDLVKETAERMWAAVEWAKAEEALRENRQLLQTVIDNSLDHVQLFEAVRDENNQIIDFKWMLTNKKWNDVWGEMKGKSLLHENPGVLEAGLFESFVRVTETGQPIVTELQYAYEQFNGWFNAAIVKQGDGFLLTTQEITERKKAEEALRESEEQFRRAIENAPVPVILYTEDGTVLQISQTFTELTGLTLKQIPTFEKWMKYVFGPLSSELKTHLNDLFWSDGTRRLNTELSVVTIRGDRLHWSFSVSSPGYLPDGRRFLVGMAIDITERKKAEEAVQHSETRFRTLADAVPQIIWTNDARGNADYLNKRWYAYSGLTVEQSAGPGWQAIVHPDDAPAAVAKWKRALAAGDSFETEYRLRRYDGQYGWFIGRNVPLKDGAGRVTAWFGSATDIEHLKKTEEALSRSEARLRITMESATDYAIITMDTARRVERWSQGATELFGYTEEEMRGRLADVIFTEEDRKADVPQKEMEQARDTGRASDDRWHRRKDGSRFYVSGVVRPIQAEQQITGYVKVVRDVTQQQLFTEELHRLVAERTRDLQRSNDDLQQFATIAAHDLQEPLRKLRLFSSVLQRYREELPDEGREVLTKISLTSDRMSQLIREVLQYSRLNSGIQELESTDLDAVLQEVLADLDLPWKEAGATLIYPEPLPVVDANPSQMTQLFYNLLTNALKFRKKGVPPEIRITAAPVGESERTGFSFLPPDKAYFQITVADNGIGFDPQFAEQIFQIFERLHPVDEYEGTGVGLALCKKIVENHGGHIWASATEGGGASFQVMLPVSQSS